MLFASLVTLEISKLRNQMQVALEKNLLDSEMLDIIEIQMQDLYDIEVDLANDDKNECSICSQYYDVLEELKNKYVNKLESLGVDW